MRNTQTIRIAIAARLKALQGNDLTQYFKTVYDHNKAFVNDDKLPAVSVTISGGIFDGMLDTGDGTDLNVSIKIFAKGDNIEDRLDTHAEKIEEIFAIGETLNDSVEWMNPTSFNSAFDENSTAGTMNLNYTINYED